MVQCFQTSWERSIKSTNSVCIENILIPSRNERSLSAKSSIWIQTSSARSCSSWDARNSGSFNKRSWIPLECLLMHFFFKSRAWWYSFLSGVFPYLWPWSLLNHVVLNWEKVQCILDDASDGFTFFHFLSRDARMCNRQCLCSNVSRTIQTDLRCPRRQSFSWTSLFSCRSRWRDCRWGGSRSSWQNMIVLSLFDSRML